LDVEAFDIFAVGEAVHGGEEPVGVVGAAGDDEAVDA
jgi:hypothetical protein